MVRQNPHIRSLPADDRGQQQTVQCAVRMIRRDEQGPTGRDHVQFRVRYTRLYIECLQRPAFEGCVPVRLRPFVQRPTGAQPQQPGEEGPRGDDRRAIGRGRGGVDLKWIARHGVAGWMLSLAMRLQRSTRTPCEARWTTPGARGATEPSQPSASSPAFLRLLASRALRCRAASAPRGSSRAAARYTPGRSHEFPFAPSVDRLAYSTPRTVRRDGRLPGMPAGGRRSILLAFVGVTAI